jgi:hypothetical protein
MITSLILKRGFDSETPPGTDARSCWAEQFLAGDCALRLSVFPGPGPRCA